MVIKGRHLLDMLLLTKNGDFFDKLSSTQAQKFLDDELGWLNHFFRNSEASMVPYPITLDSNSLDYLRK